MDKVKSVIYKITNLISREMYIGSTVDLVQRKGQHLYMLRRNIHFNRYLQDAFNKYGEINFSFEVIEYIKETDDLIIKEQYYLNYHQSYKRGVGYNIGAVAENNSGIKFSEEVRKKLSEAHKGKKLSEERIMKRRLKITNQNTSGFKGVSWDKSHNKWRVAIYINNTTKHLGRFDDKSFAAKIYDEAALEYFGENTYLNFG